MHRTNRIVLHIVLAVVVGTTLFAALAVPFALHALAVAHYRFAGDYGVADRFDRFDGGMMGRGWTPEGGCGVQEYVPETSGCAGLDGAGYRY